MDEQALRRRMAAHRTTLQQARGEYAVLVPLVEGPEGLSLLYEVRPAKLHHHSGEVCFPRGTDGGRGDAPAVRPAGDLRGTGPSGGGH